MNFANFVIVYVACGMPFAVYRFVLSSNDTAGTALRSFSAALLWPIDGGKAAIKRLRSASRSLARPRIDNIRFEMEEFLAQTSPNLRRFEFREVFDRYAGLAGSAGANASTGYSELYRICGEGLPPAAAACLDRTFRARIDGHTAAARRELVEYLALAPSQRL